MLCYKVNSSFLNYLFLSWETNIFEMSQRLGVSVWVCASMYAILFFRDVCECVVVVSLGAHCAR